MDSKELYYIYIIINLLINQNKLEKPARNIALI